jgi:hypothetical protein
MPIFSPLEVIGGKIALLGTFGNDNPMRGSAIGDEDNRARVLGRTVQGRTNSPGFTKVNWTNLPFVLTSFGANLTFFELKGSNHGKNGS